MEKIQNSTKSFKCTLAPLVHAPNLPTTRMPRLSTQDHGTTSSPGDNSSGSNYLGRREKLRKVLAMMDRGSKLMEARRLRVQQQNRDWDAAKTSRPTRRPWTPLVPSVRQPRPSGNRIEAERPLIDVQLGRGVVANGKTLTKCPQNGAEEDTDAKRPSVRDRKFRKLHTIAKIIGLLLRLCKRHILAEKDAEMVKLFSAIDTAQAGKKYTVQGDMFDATAYRTQKQDSISSKTKRVMEMPPPARTEQDIHLVQVELQQVEFVTKYPVHMQRSLIQYGTYESYETGRVIIRHGRRPYAFYLVLAGSALLIEGDPENSGRSATPLFKGHAFGHEAIINRDWHKVTVISKEHIELLSLTVEEYSRIFLAGGMSNISSADGSGFIENINIFKGWPVHLFKQHPKKCRFNFYTKGTVIEPDSNHSEWIYILKSGSCAVLKKLILGEQVPAKRRHKRPMVSTRAVASLAISHQEQLSNKLRDMQRKRAKTLLGKSRRLTDARPTNMLRIPVRDDPLSTEIDNNACASALHEAVNQRYNVPAIVVSDSAHYSIPSAIAADNGSQAVWSFQQLSLEKESLMTDGETGSALNSFRSGFTARGPFLTHNIRLSSINEGQHTDARGPKFPSENDEAPPRVRRTSRFEPETVSTLEATHREDCLTNLHVSTSFTQSQTRAQPRKIGRDVFVQIDTLEKGAVFGASQIIFDRQPSLSLVSNGSECILVDKKFYVKNATETNLKRVNDLFRPYPSEDSLRRDLQEKLTWQDNRKRALSDALRNLRRHRRKTPASLGRAAHDTNTVQ